MHKIGLIGYGSIASGYHTDTFKREDVPFELAAVFDIRESQRNLAAERGYKVFDNLKDFLDSRLFEMVTIAVPNNNHCPIAIACLEAGYHVMVEKPAALSCAEIEKIEGVAEVMAHFEIQEGFQTIQSILNLASLIIIAVLFVVSMLIISNTVKLAMYDRKDEIAIMKMVGATNGFIRWPFVVEGFILGFTAAVVAFFLQWGLYNFLEAQIVTLDTLQLFTMVPFVEVIEIVAIAYAIVGFVVGVFGSVLSIRKFLKV